MCYRCFHLWPCPFFLSCYIREAYICVAEPLFILYSQKHISSRCSSSSTKNNSWRQWKRDTTSRRITHVAVICNKRKYRIYAMCMAAERLKMGIPQQAAGWETNRLAGWSSEGFDWLLGSPVVMMMGIGSCLCGLYPGTEVHWSKWYGWIGCRTFCPPHIHTQSLVCVCNVNAKFPEYDHWCFFSNPHWTYLWWLCLCTNVTRWRSICPT